MSQTIEDFRGLFKHNKEKQEFNLYTVTREVLKLMENTLKEINVTVEITKKTSMYNYKNEFIQVLIILLNNAKEALVQREIIDKSILIHTAIDAHNIQITVEDNAGGIASEHSDKIFNPYYTTKDQSGGTGLGLYISKIIIEHNMGGEIAAANTETGACFILKIPHTPDDSS
jgi:C4-dicarboxylate-specific signal transduction histidine kinase